MKKGKIPAGKSKRHMQKQIPCRGGACYWRKCLANAREVQYFFLNYA